MHLCTYSVCGFLTQICAHLLLEYKSKIHILKPYIPCLFPPRPALLFEREWTSGLHTGKNAASLPKDTLHKMKCIKSLAG